MSLSPHRDNMSPSSGKVRGDGDLVVDVVDTDLGAIKTSPQVELDAPTGAQVVIEVTHHEVHEGEAFSCAHVFADVAAGASVMIELRTNAREVHLKQRSASVVGAQRSEALLEVIEDPTIGTPGTALVVTPNRLRTSETIATMLAFSDPAGIAGGLLLETFATGGAQGAEVTDFNEWILDGDSHYIIRATNNSNQQADVHINLFWYEEEERA